MSAEMLYTEREMALAKRAAFVDGQAAACWRDPATQRDGMAHAAAYAAELYPLPKIVRPRTAKDPLEWRIRWTVSDDRIVGEAVDAGHWYPISDGHSAFAPYDARVQVWADLLANRTELVDDPANLPSQQTGGRE